MNSKKRKKSDPYLPTAVAKLGIWALGVTSSRCFGREDESLLAVTASRQDDEPCAARRREARSRERRRRIDSDRWRGLVRKRNRRSCKGQAFGAPAVLVLHVHGLGYCLLGLPLALPLCLVLRCKAGPAGPCCVGLLGAFVVWMCSAPLPGSGSNYFLAGVLAGQNSFGT